jgi:hypothetical protein
MEIMVEARDLAKTFKNPDGTEVHAVKGGEMFLKGT